MSKKINVDTALLKQLVAELDVLLSSAQSAKDSISREDRNTTNAFIIEMQKAAGLSSGIAQEAAGLIADITGEVRAQFASNKGYDALSDILGISPSGSSGGFGGFGSGSGRSN